ncbi:MAG: ribosome-binding factor A [Gemmataceae bacterium]
MTSRKISRRELLSSCADVGAGDGCDPRLDRREGSAKVPNRKALQLCAQVARTLRGVFAECGDDVLRELTIESVTPAPNAARLLVTVRPAVPLEMAGVLERLVHARAKLRTDAVAAIHRRRAPDLLFRVLEPEL